MATADMSCSAEHLAVNLHGKTYQHSIRLEAANIACSLGQRLSVHASLLTRASCVDSALTLAPRRGCSERCEAALQRRDGLQQAPVKDQST